MTADTKLLPLPEPNGSYTNPFDSDDLTNYARANVAHATAAKDAEIEALRAEVERLREIVRPKREEECLTLDHWRMRAYDLEANWSRCSRACAGEQDKREEAEARADKLRAEVERLSQLVNGGKGPLPEGAVAWLDMGLQEASLVFDKKTDSNRANKRRVRELFQRVSSGHYPLYLEPQADRAERLTEALRDLLSWFPEKPAPSEWRILAGEQGADDAIEYARAALHPATAAKDAEIEALRVDDLIGQEEGK